MVRDILSVKAGLSRGCVVTAVAVAPDDDSCFPAVAGALCDSFAVVVRENVLRATLSRAPESFCSKVLDSSSR